MPTPAYMSIEGLRQGNISAGANSMESMGNRYQEEHEDEITLQSYKHDIIIPRDPQSGQPSGQRVHQAFTVSKIFDKSSPLLYAALTSGERLSKVTIKWFRTSMQGTQEHYFTHELEDGMIVDIKGYMPNALDPSLGHMTHMEDISFTYRKISWTHEISGTSGSDDWRAPNM